MNKLLKGAEGLEHHIRPESIKKIEIGQHQEK
jgi:hypothetical protein